MDTFLCCLERLWKKSKKLAFLQFFEQNCFRTSQKPKMAKKLIFLIFFKVFLSNIGMYPLYFWVSKTSQEHMGIFLSVQPNWVALDFFAISHISSQLSCPYMYCMLSGMGRVCFRVIKMIFASFLTIKTRNLIRKMKTNVQKRLKSAVKQQNSLLQTLLPESTGNYLSPVCPSIFHISFKFWDIGDSKYTFLALRECVLSLQYLKI